MTESKRYGSPKETLNRFRNPHLREDGTGVNQLSQLTGSRGKGFWQINKNFEEYGF
jgi:hypothetical protein